VALNVLLLVIAADTALAQGTGDDPAGATGLLTAIAAVKTAFNCGRTHTRAVDIMSTGLSAAALVFPTIEMTVCHAP